MITIQEAQNNPALFDKFIEENMPLVKSVINSQFGFVKNTERYDDYFQVGCIGLYKATCKFDDSYNTAFSTYAVPRISGEIRRYRRDFEQSLIHISRDASQKYRLFVDCKSKGLSDEESCKRIGTTLYEIYEIINSYNIHSVDEIVFGEDDSHSIKMIDVVTNGRNIEDSLIEEISVKRTLERLKNTLSSDCYMVLILTAKGLSQNEIAAKIGVTQMQVSRLLKRARNAYKAINPENDYSQYRRKKNRTSKIVVGA